MSKPKRRGRGGARKVFPNQLHKQQRLLSVPSAKFARKQALISLSSSGKS